MILIQSPKERERRKQDSSLSLEEDPETERKAAKKEYRYECSSEVCTNKVIIHGVLCVRHGTKRRRNVALRDVDVRIKSHRSNGAVARDVQAWTRVQV